jgi:hypothetical protein
MVRRVPRLGGWTLLPGRCDIFSSLFQRGAALLWPRIADGWPNVFRSIGQFLEMNLPPFVRIFFKAAQNSGWLRSSAVGELARHCSRTRSPLRAAETAGYVAPLHSPHALSVEIFVSVDTCSYF